MGQILHGSATTTHAIRVMIQRSKALLQELAARYGLNRKTVALDGADGRGGGRRQDRQEALQALPYRLLPLVILAATATATAAQPDPGVDDGLAALRQQDARVNAIAFRLATANVELCTAKGPQSGLLLQDAHEYGPKVRAAAIHDLGLSGAPSIEAVAPGSPAAQAGLQPGDTLLSINSARFYLSPPKPDAPATNAILDRERDLLDGALAIGPATVEFLRAGKPMRASIAPVPGCAYRFELYPSPKLEASSDGRRVLISSAFTRFADRDDDLAVLLGHEMGHNILDHVAHPTGSARSRERAADYWGAYLAARAGYDVLGAVTLWRRVGEDSWIQNFAVFGHPSPTARSRAMEAVAAEIRAKRAAGQPLVPDSGANR